MAASVAAIRISPHRLRGEVPCSVGRPFGHPNVRSRLPVDTSHMVVPLRDADEVIAEVSAALKALYSPLLPGGAALRFGAPTGDPGHGLSFFLASVQEDPRAVPADWEDVRDGHGHVRGRQPPIRRFDLLYLVTAWAKDSEREEALLDIVLDATAPNLRLDPKLLGGTLRDAPHPVLVRLVGDATQVWASLDLPPRTVLGLNVNAPLIRPLSTELAPPADQIMLGVDRSAPLGAPGLQGPAVRKPGQWRKSRIDEHGPSQPSA
jgi:hypothetical protein